LQVKEQSDLNRTVIKSEYASLEVPELNLEVPFKSQPGGKHSFFETNKRIFKKSQRLKAF
jgi:C4-type Zn-finger protein